MRMWAQEKKHQRLFILQFSKDHYASQPLLHDVALTVNVHLLLCIERSGDILSTAFKKIVPPVHIELGDDLTIPLCCYLNQTISSHLCCYTD